MFNELKNIRPNPDYILPVLITFGDDEHISKGMLEAHLNPNWDAV